LFPHCLQLAQWAGSRRDLFPAALCKIFARLHANGRPHPFAHTRRAVCAAFHVPDTDDDFDSLFKAFGHEPMGVGAVAQVYKAVLNPRLLAHESDAEKAVAVKVLHPKAAKMIYRDLRLMALFAALLDCIPGVEWLSLPDEVEEFGKLMKSQLDLRGEAANLVRFRANFAQRRHEDVDFPRPLTLFTSRHVLVEEFEDAIPLRAFLNASGGPFDDRIAHLGLDTFLVRLGSVALQTLC
jgi:aarF domain-containing kinase